VQLIIGTIVIGVILMTLAAVRITRIASWRAVAMIAASTGSLRSCVAFIRYCERI
jgi:hypothetical protein